jgi:hypothetical protein
VRLGLLSARCGVRLGEIKKKTFLGLALWVFVPKKSTDHRSLFVNFELINLFWLEIWEHKVKRK